MPRSVQFVLGQSRISCYCEYVENGHISGVAPRSPMASLFRVEGLGQFFLQQIEFLDFLDTPDVEKYEVPYIWRIFKNG